MYDTLVNNYKFNQYLFVFLVLFILLQPYLGILFVTLNLNSKIILLCRDILIFIMFTFLLTKLKYKVILIDKLFVLFLFLSFINIFRSDDFISSIYSFRLYAMPIMLYFIGRFVIPLQFNISKLMNLIAILFILSCILALVISYNHDLIAFINDGSDYKIDFLGNFYTYFSDGSMINRFIGPFMDPLATAFFIVPLITYFYFFDYSIRNKIFFYILLFFLIITLTKAIIITMITVFFLLKKKKNGEYQSNVYWIFVLLPFLFLILFFNYEFIIGKVDPSTYGHLFAYYSNLNAFINQPEGYGYFRYSEVIPIEFKSTETVYFGVLLEQGIFSLLVLIFLLYKVYKYITLRLNNHKINLVIHSSFAIYIIASFTTEHFFATTSSFLFWILLGYTIKLNLYSEKIR